MSELIKRVEFLYPIPEEKETKADELIDGITWPLYSVENNNGETEEFTIEEVMLVKSNIGASSDSSSDSYVKDIGNYLDLYDEPFAIKMKTDGPDSADWGVLESYFKKLIENNEEGITDRLSFEEFKNMPTPTIKSTLSSSSTQLDDELATITFGNHSFKIKENGIYTQNNIHIRDVSENTTLKEITSELHTYSAIAMDKTNESIISKP